MFLALKLDENIPASAVEPIRLAGRDASTVFLQAMGGATDTGVAVTCREEHRSLVTLDLDFSDTRPQPVWLEAGIGVLRPEVQSTAAVLELVRFMIAAVARGPVVGALWITSTDPRSGSRLTRVTRRPEMDG